MDNGELIESWNGLDPNSDPRELCLVGNALADSLERAEAELARLSALINNPHTENFMQSVQLEAAHQQLRWGSDHDAGKTDADWFWLIGYLAGKAIRPDQPAEKRLHHIITTAAACLNWHAHSTGSNGAMRPGISKEKQAAIDGRPEAP